MDSDYGANYYIGVTLKQINTFSIKFINFLITVSDYQTRIIIVLINILFRNIRRKSAQVIQQSELN